MNRTFKKSDKLYQIKEGFITEYIYVCPITDAYPEYKGYGYPEYEENLYHIVLEVDSDDGLEIKSFSTEELNNNFFYDLDKAKLFALENALDILNNTFPSIEDPFSEELNKLYGELTEKFE